MMESTYIQKHILTEKYGWRVQGVVLLRRHLPGSGSIAGLTRNMSQLDDVLALHMHWIWQEQMML